MKVKAGNKVAYYQNGSLVCRETYGMEEGLNDHICYKQEFFELGTKLSKHKKGDYPKVQKILKFIKEYK